MCGIVGIYLKSEKFESLLGKMLSGMLINMGSRGPDSAGFAIYKKEDDEEYKYSLCINNISFEKFKNDLNNKISFSDFKENSDHVVVKSKDDPKKVLKIITSEFKNDLKNKISFSDFKKNSDHVVLKSKDDPKKVLEILTSEFKEVSVVGYGKSIEIFKQVGEPKDVVKKFNLESFSGTHGIGHTRMATESAITTDGSHPYSTGEDECLVHNGSLSNHNNLRRKLKKNGINFNSENDTEVAAGYISNNLSNKKTLKETLKKGLNDLDGFYTFITGTRKGFAVLRDEIACKPAVIAETDDYVAIASEFQAMAHLPNVNSAKIFEPEPGIVYSWGN